MTFDLVQEEPELHTLKKVFHRKALRGIALKEGKVLLLSNLRGDYKFPGGGLESFETDEEALKREVKEETGYEVKAVGRFFGRALERKKDAFQEDTVFEMESLYYFCEVEEEKGAQHLDDYERALGFRPHWVTPEEAMEKNLLVPQEESAHNLWVKRETAVLKHLFLYLKGVEL